jgi:hypothetical protein
VTVAHDPRAGPSPRPPAPLARTVKAEWSRRVAIGCAAIAALSLFSANPLLTACGLLVIPLLVALLWRVEEPPSLLFAAGFQWIQVFVPVLQANARGEPIGTDFGAELETAAWLGLGTILVLAVGMRVGRRSRAIASREQLRERVAELSPGRLAVAYTLTLAIPSVAAFVAETVPGMYQAVLGLGLFRLMFAFLAFWAAANDVKFRRVALAVLACEIVLGFGGFFSTFKTVLFLAAIVALGNQVRAGRWLRPAVGVIALLLVLTTYWQAIKGDYRAFLNQGTRMQAVLVSPGDRLSFLMRRTADLTWFDMYEGFDRGVDRLGYLHFFGLVLQHVPAHVPYQNGRLWSDAVLHVLTPRLLFPGKGSISDSARTIEFTGVRVATEEEGTSVSLGYAAESYVDFGPIFMFLPVFVLGMFWGFSYYFLATRSTNALLCLSAATTLLLGDAILFGASNIKLLGGSLTNLIVLSLVLTMWSGRLWQLLVDRSRPRRSPVLVR